MSSSEKMKLIIDTDGVVDDIRAISLALSQPNVEVLAITTTHGCVSVHQAAANVARTLRANKKSVPIYKGASVAILKPNPPIDESFFFGQDGLGDLPEVEPTVLPTDLTSSWVPEEAAALALIRLTREHPDAVLACIGPLTNVALAIKLDDNFVRQPKKLVIMGGNYFGVGNVNSFSSAEFNFFGDPEAASIVLSEMESPITIVPWEAFFIHNAKYEKEVNFHAHLDFGTPLAEYFKAATSIGRAELEKSGRQYGYCDEIAVTTAIAPEKTIKDKKIMRVSVELAGKFSRGQVVPDWIGQLWQSEECSRQPDKSRPPITFVTDYDVHYVDQLICDMVRNSK